MKTNFAKSESAVEISHGFNNGISGNKIILIPGAWDGEAWPRRFLPAIDAFGSEPDKPWIPAIAASLSGPIVHLY